jgi:hypothetical protein
MLICYPLRPKLHATESLSYIDLLKLTKLQKYININRFK